MTGLAITPEGKLDCDIDLSELSASTATDLLDSDLFQDFDTAIEGNNAEIELNSASVNESAVEFQKSPAAPPSKLFFSVCTDEDGQVVGEVVEDEPGLLRFPLKLLNFFIRLVTLDNGDQEYHVYGMAREPNVEWKFEAQVRILTAIDEDKRPLRVVDYDVFQFGNRIPPIIFINRDDKLTHVRLQLRYVHRFYEVLPKLDEGNGNTVIYFNDDESPLWAHGSLLALHSPILAELLKNSYDPLNDEYSLTITECSRESFTEFLYYIYSSNRPLWAHFKGLANAAVAYKALFVLERLQRHLIYFDKGFVEKLQEAFKLRFDDAAGELAYNAEKNGVWQYLISTGFDPKAQYGEANYHRVLCPAILKAKLTDKSHVPYRQLYAPTFKFDSPEEPFTVRLMVSGRTFHVNKGILQLYNMSELGRGNDGEYFLRISVALRRHLESHDLKLGDVVHQMLLHMYPAPVSQHSTPIQRTCRVLIRFVRPIIILAFDNKMPRLKDELEDGLAMQPPCTSEILLDHLEFAEKYNLRNLMACTLLRIEANYASVASQLITTPAFRERLSEQTRATVSDRMVSGWAQTSYKLANRIPTRGTKRFFEADNGGAEKNVNDDDLVTFKDIHSAYAFGENEDLECNEVS